MATIGEKEAKRQQKNGKTGRKSYFSDYGHGYRLGYCCSTDEFHVFFQIVGTENVNPTPDPVNGKSCSTKPTRRDVPDTSSSEYNLFSLA